MIRNYDSINLETEDGLIEDVNLMTVFIPTKSIKSDGQFNSFSVGNRTLHSESGLSFIVDDYVAEQLSKCRIDFSENLPRLIEKEDETILDNLTKEEREIKDMEIELIKRKARLN